MLPRSLLHNASVLFDEVVTGVGIVTVPPVVVVQPFASFTVIVYDPPAKPLKTFEA